MLDKIFGWGKKKDENPLNHEIPFGRYSDNNKPVAKVARWADADNLFKEKNIQTAWMLFLNTCLTIQCRI